MTGKCIAYLDNGHICGKPAFILDRQRGGMVCPEHEPGPGQTSKADLTKKEQVNR